MLVRDGNVCLKTGILVERHSCNSADVAFLYLIPLSCPRGSAHDIGPAMPAQETWIARPGELIRAGQAVSELATRVGGLPTYPDGCKPPPTELTTCQVCNKPLALLLQVGGVCHHACRRRLPGSKLQPLAALRLLTH